MMPEPNRQWFVYFKDKEMGPFTEADLHSKLKTSEIDSSAYVFTEGMSDWALVEETEIFAAKGAVAPAASAPAATATSASTTTTSAKATVVSGGGATVQTETLGASPKVKAEPTLAAGKLNTHKAAPVEKKPLVRRGVIYGLLALVVLVLGLSFWMEQGGYVPVLSDMLGPDPHAVSKDPVAQNGVTAAGAPVSEVGQNPSKTPEVPRGFAWEELQAFRKSEDPKGAPFRIASHALGDMRPVVVGVLSPLIKADVVRVVVFPDNERSLMPVGKIWRVNASVLDGYFVVGPLNVEGSELPAGRYHLMAAAAESFLGEVTFEVGDWPSDSKLVEIQTQLQKDRALLAERERTALEAKLREVTGAIEQLKQHGRTAALGPKGAKDWTRLIEPWRTALYKALEDQRSAMSGPMFYNDAQTKLYGLMFEALKVQESLDIFSRAGAKALQSAKRKNLGQLWADLSAMESNVAGEIRILGQQAVGPFRLDPAVIKKQLVEVR